SRCLLIEDNRPIRSPEIRKTTRAATLRGSSMVSVYIGGRKKKLNPTVAVIAATVPGPLSQTQAERKTASRRTSGTVESAGSRGGFKRASVAKTRRTEAG